MKKRHLIQRQPLRSEIFRYAPIVSFKRGRSLKDLLVQAKLWARDQWVLHDMNRISRCVGLPTTLSSTLPPEDDWMPFSWENFRSWSNFCRWKYSRFLLPSSPDVPISIMINQRFCSFNGASIISQTKPNLVPRVSLLCLHCRWENNNGGREERPWERGWTKPKSVLRKRPKTPKHTNNLATFP